MRRTIVLAAVAAMLLAGCDGAGPDGASTSGEAGSTTPSTSPPPSPAEGWSGSATLDLHDGADASVELPIVFGTVSLDPSELVVAWTDPTGGYALAVLWSGTDPPEPGMALEGALLTIAMPETVASGAYADTRGTCVTTLETYGPRRMTGTFRCPDLRSGDRRLPNLEATGSFGVQRSV